MIYDFNPAAAASSWAPQTLVTWCRCIQRGKEKAREKPGQGNKLHSTNGLCALAPYTSTRKEDKEEVEEVEEQQSWNGNRSRRRII